MSYYKPEIWAMMRGLYESGTFKSIEDLQKSCKKSFNGRVPSVSALQKKAISENWDKKKSNPEKSEAVRKTYAEMFTQLGINDEKIVALTIQGICAGEDLAQKILDRCAEEGPNVLDPGYALMVKDFHVNLGTRLKYLQEYHKLCGSYAPEKVQHSGKIKQEMSTVKDIDAMSEAELAEELARVNRSLTRLS
jgi:hypothetical protein